MSSFPTIFESRSFAHLPCQSGSGLLILSSPSSAAIAATWNGFKADSTKWYDVTPSLEIFTEASDAPVIYDANFAADRLFLVTSRGLLTTDPLSSLCWDTKGAECRKVSFSKMVLPVNSSIVKWDSAELSHTPVCANMDHIPVKGDGIFLKIQMHDGTKNLLQLFEPYEAWTFVSNFAGGSTSLLTFVYNVHARQLTVYKANQDETEASALTMSALERNQVSFPSFTFSGFLPYQAVSLSSSFIILVGKFAIWNSVDGGTFYFRLFPLQPNEKLLSSAVHEHTKSAAFLLSSGRVLIIRLGTTEIYQDSTGLDNSPILVFDNDGKLHVIKSQSPAAFSSSSIAIRLVGDKYGGDCKSFLVPAFPAKSLVYVDRGSKYVLEVKGYRSGALRLPILTSVVSNSKLLQARIEFTNASDYSQKISVKISNEQYNEGVGSVTILLKDAEWPCLSVSYTVNIIFSCPPEKRLVFDYSSLVPPEYLLSVEDYANFSSHHSMMHILEKNYRPPSAMGISIPLSKNIYHFDPETLQRTHLVEYKFLEKHRVSEYCEGKTSRSECECSSALKFSSLEEHSDCREMVYEVKYDSEYPIKVTVLDDLQSSQERFTDAEYMMYLEEVNNRGDDVHFISDGDERMCPDSSSHAICQGYFDQTENRQAAYEYFSYGSGKALYNSTTIVIKFLGTGLFHFRIVLAKGYSYCKLQDEFQVYVTNPPLPFPVGTIIRLVVSAAMGAALVAIYIKSLSRSQSPSSAPEKNQKHWSREINSSYVREEDVINLRHKFRSSFHASHA